MLIPSPVVFPPALWPPRVRFRGNLLKFRPREVLSVLHDISCENWTAIIPGSLTDDSLKFINKLFVDEALELSQMQSLAHKTIESLTGTTWGASHRLAATVVGNWFIFLAWAVETGFDYKAASLSELIAAGYVLAKTECADGKELTQLNAKIWPLKETHTTRLEEQLNSQALQGMRFDADGIPIG